MHRFFVCKNLGIVTVIEFKCNCSQLFTILLKMCLLSSEIYNWIYISGFTGNNCELNYDDCITLPCLNGGSCVDGIDSYTCQCASGYTGLNCSTDVNECSSSPCANGVCHDLPNAFQVNYVD